MLHQRADGDEPSALELGFSETLSDMKLSDFSLCETWLGASSTTCFLSVDRLKIEILRRIAYF